MSKAPISGLVSGGENPSCNWFLLSRSCGATAHPWGLGKKGD